VNTSSIIGLFKEIIIDRSICGVLLEENIVVIAACNPARRRLITGSSICQREIDLGKEWVSGHYQVSHLPESVAKLKWAYGSLSADHEREFVRRRVEMLGDKILPEGLISYLSDLIYVSHESIRVLASNHMMSMSQKTLSKEELDQRAQSTVSLRDIQRVFTLFQFFLNDFSITCDNATPVSARYLHAMFLAIAVAYYMRLVSRSRQIFLDRIESVIGNEGINFKEVLDYAIDIVVRNTEIPQGIADTRGLRENIFMTLVCCLCQTPLMIIGPPGSSKVSLACTFKTCNANFFRIFNLHGILCFGFSFLTIRKTLSLNIVSDNADGEQSRNPFYRKYARLTFFHYQVRATLFSVYNPGLLAVTIQQNPSTERTLWRARVTSVCRVSCYLLLSLRTNFFTRTLLFPLSCSLRNVV